MSPPRYLLWPFLGLCGVMSQARAGETEIQRFREEYPEACARIQDVYSSLSGTIEIEEKSGDRERQLQVEFQNAPDRSLARMEAGPAPGHELELVLCVRPEGHYALARKPDGSGYTVQSLGLFAEAMFAKNVGQYLRAPYSFLGEPFDRLVADPTLRIVSAETIFSDDQRAIELTYTFGEGRPMTRTTRIPPHEATFVFDPERNWVMTRGRIRLPDVAPDMAISFSVDYAEEGAIDSIPIVSRVVYTENDRTATWRFTDVTPAVVDPALFSMTAFGLPELSEDPPRRTNWTPYILALSAFLAFGIGLWLRRLARGRAMTRAS